MDESLGGFQDYPWRLTYSTSGDAQGSAIDILHDFYIPALKRSVRYDRLAGYFRSSSLAAASQGFSAMAEAAGKVRMVVGADLDPGDVRAIVDASDVELSKVLLSELGDEAGWPQDVRNGVGLLAWMVAGGMLEMRVAFRVHADTGQPLDFDSREDGYVHEKWAVLEDTQGARLYATGSFNESRTALVRNAENIDVHRDWSNEENRQRVDEAEARFERVWNGENPSLRVRTLPEAVRERLIRIAERITRPIEIDGTSAAPLEVAPPSALERLRFQLIKDGPRLPGGRFVGMVTAPVRPWPHQEVVARRVIDSWPYSYLLCDEVGLGKTIEAGLIIRSLYLSGLVNRVLVSPPASLTRQWQREMASKFLLPFARAISGAQCSHEYLMPFEETRAASSLYDPDLAIVSTGLVSRAQRQNELRRARDFDLALVDEAHYARRSNPTGGTRAHPRFGRLYESLLGILREKSRSLLLATATPMQLDAVEVADLARLTNRVGAFQLDPGLFAAYYDLLAKLVHDEPVDEDEWAFLRRSVSEVASQDPLLWDYLQQSVIDFGSKLDCDQWIQSGLNPVGYAIEGVRRFIFAASPLSRVMLRHTRPLLEVYRVRGQLSANLARRTILPIVPIQFTSQEERAYAELEAYCQGLAQELAATGERQNRFSVGFYLSFLRLRFASSLYAIRETLRRRRERVDATLAHLDSADEESDDLLLADALNEGEDDREAVHSFLKERTPKDLEWERVRLSRMLEKMEDLSPMSSKLKRLLEYLEKRRLAGGRIQQTVVFTRFYDTLTDIVERLRRVHPQMLIGTYSGQGGSYYDPARHRIVGVERDEIKHRFLRGEIDVLICTDAAAEGLNLQTADLLVNFDLPWNPMKVEQRIGRIDRIGQAHSEIFVSNLCYLGSAEEVVYGRLLDRLTNAGLLVGTQQLSLLPVMPEEFQELAEKRLSEHELGSRAMERARLARRHTESMELPARELYEIYNRMTSAPDWRSAPLDLDDIWATLAESRHLHDLGCVVGPDPEQPTLEIHDVPDLSHGAVLTTSPELQERGLPDAGVRLRFASYGDPEFDGLIDYMCRDDLPESVARISVPVEDFRTERVGFAVAAVNPDGRREVRLVRSFPDLQGLAIDEGAKLGESDVAPIRARIESMARAEFDRPRSVGDLERGNVAAGASQLALSLLVARGWMLDRKHLGAGNERFWKEFEALEAQARKRGKLRIGRIPAATARQLAGTLFKAVVPTVGADAYIVAPEIQLLAALDAAARVAESLKVARSQLSVDQVLGAIDKQLVALTQPTTAGRSHRSARSPQ